MLLGRHALSQRIASTSRGDSQGDGSIKVQDYPISSLMRWSRMDCLCWAKDLGGCNLILQVNYPSYFRGLSLSFATVLNRPRGYSTSRRLRHAGLLRVCVPRLTTRRI